MKWKSKGFGSELNWIAWPSSLTEFRGRCLLYVISGSCCTMWLCFNRNLLLPTHLRMCANGFWTVILKKYSIVCHFLLSLLISFYWYLWELNFIYWCLICHSPGSTCPSYLVVLSLEVAITMMCLCRKSLTTYWLTSILVFCRCVFNSTCLSVIRTFVWTSKYFLNWFIEM